MYMHARRKAARRSEDIMEGVFDQLNASFVYIKEKCRQSCQKCRRRFYFTAKMNEEKLALAQHTTLECFGLCLKCTINNWCRERQKFMIYYCALHEFNLDEETMLTKCVKRTCVHLFRRYVDKIIVNNIREAMKIKNNHEEMWVLPKDGVYHITHKRRT